MVGLGNIDDVYKHYLKVIDENKRLEKKLEIAVNALEEVIKENEGCMDCMRRPVSLVSYLGKDDCKGCL